MIHQINLILHTHILQLNKVPSKEFSYNKGFAPKRSSYFRMQPSILWSQWSHLRQRVEAVVGRSWSAVAAPSSLSLLLLLIYGQTPSRGKWDCVCVCLCVGPLQRNSVVVGVTSQTNLGAGCGIYHLCTTHSWMSQIKMFLLWSCQTVWFSSCPHNVMKWLSYLTKWRGDRSTNHEFILISCTHCYYLGFSLVVHHL